MNSVKLLSKPPYEIQLVSPWLLLLAVVATVWHKYRKACSQFGQSKLSGYLSALYVGVISLYIIVKFASAKDIHYNTGGSE